MVSSSSENLVHNEVMIAADPTNADRLITCTITVVNSLYVPLATSRTAAYTSADNGKTWTKAITHPSFSWDPDCAFDTRGRAYFIAGTSQQGLRGTLRYENQAGQWQPPLTIHTMYDRPWISPAPDGGMYVSYTPENPAVPAMGKGQHAGAVARLNAQTFQSRS